MKYKNQRLFLHHQHSIRILLKFGFDYVGDDDCGYNYRHSETRMVIWDRLDGLYFRSDLGDVKLECVHYFQNLFFCLTGKEVEINDRQ